MAAPPHTVFLCYRRKPSLYIARAILLYLRQRGYDVFMDTESLDSGRFEQKILDAIVARQHFLVILTRGTLEGCQNLEDWVRREIECAITSKRNIVPILVNDFDFDKHTRTRLPETLRALPEFNTLRLFDEYFNEAMERLCLRFLKSPQSCDDGLDGTLGGEHDGDAC